MCRIEGSGGVTINCWQLIIIHKYINRGHRTLKLQEPCCLDIGVATCGRPGCPGWQSHPCDLCREGWNMAPRLHWHWEPVQKQWRFNCSAVNKSAECASLLGIAVNIVHYCFYYCRVRTGFCHFAPLWWLARLWCRSVSGFSPKVYNTIFIRIYLINVIIQIHLSSISLTIALHNILE